MHLHAFHSSAQDEPIIAIYWRGPVIDEAPITSESKTEFCLDQFHFDISNDISVSPFVG